MGGDDDESVSMSFFPNKKMSSREGGEGRGAGNRLPRDLERGGKGGQGGAEGRRGKRYTHGVTLVRMGLGDG